MDRVYSIIYWSIYDVIISLRYGTEVATAAAHAAAQDSVTLLIRRIGDDVADYACLQPAVPVTVPECVAVAHAY